MNTTQTTQTTDIDKLGAAIESHNTILTRLLDRMDNLTERLLNCERNHLNAMSEIEDNLLDIRDFIGIDDSDAVSPLPSTVGDIESIHHHLDDAMEEIRGMMADPSFSDPTPSVPDPHNLDLPPFDADFPSLDTILDYAATIGDLTPDEAWEHRASGQTFESRPDFLSDLDDAPPHGIERPVPIHEHDFDHLDRVERPELPFSEFDREPEPIHHDEEARVEPWYAEEGETNIAVDRNGNWLRKGDTVQYAYNGALYLGCVHRMFAPSHKFVWVELAPTDARHRLTPVSIVPTEHLVWTDDSDDELTPYDEMF